MWPVCVEEIVSQKMLLPIVPWFLKKYKPWTAKDIEVQHLYLGRSPPMFTEIRVLQNSNSDDHLVLEIGMNFRTADDMSAILGVKLRKRLGFGMWAKLHLLGMHIEGKVLVGVKFLRVWPFISRLRVCFSGPPYFQMTAKPIFTHGLDVTEVPGIAGWIDNLLSLVFEQTLVEPNMLVVDVEKFVSPQPGNWFSVDAKEPIAHAIVEVLEAAEMKPSDLNGLADPYVKGQLGPFRFRTKTRKKTLAPKWLEEFKIPICTWDSENMLFIEVRDKDHIFDDMMGDCSVNINELRDGQRHDIWLPLENIKMGRLHLAVTVYDVNGKGSEPLRNSEGLDNDNKRNLAEANPASTGFEVDSSRKSFEADSSPKSSFSSRIPEISPEVADKFEPVNIEGQMDTGIWIHQPGSEVVQVWEPRKGKRKHLDTHRLNAQGKDEAGASVGSCKSTETVSGLNDGSSTDESTDSNKQQARHSVRQGLRKIGSIFHRSPRGDDKSLSLGETQSSPRDNIALNAKKAGVSLIEDDTIVPPSLKSPKDEKECLEESGLESPHGNVKDVAKNLLKQAGKSARGLKSALSRKRSSKYKAESGSSPTDKDACLEPDTSDDDTLSPSTAAALAGGGLLISGSAISGPALGSGDDSFKSKDIIEKATHSASSSGNSSFNSKDTAIQKSTLSANNSFKSADNTIQTGAESGGNSSKPVDNAS
jgi:hypothetical protein